MKRLIVVLGLVMWSVVTLPQSVSALTPCVNVAHVGDSTTVMMVKPLRADYTTAGFPDVIIDAGGARSINQALKRDHNHRSGLRAVAAVKASGFHGCWVIALGTNDTANTAAMGLAGPKGAPHDDGLIDALVSAIGDEPILWVNVYLPSTHAKYANARQQVEWNAALDRAVGRYPNLHVYDWASVAQRGWMTPDLVHYTPKGSVIRAQSIVQALQDEVINAGN